MESNKKTIITILCDDSYLKKIIEKILFFRFEFIKYFF